MNSHCPFVLKHSHCVLSMFGHDVGHLEQNWLYHCIFDLDHDFFDLDYDGRDLDYDGRDLDYDGRDLDYGFFDAVRCDLDYYFVDHGGSVVANARCIVSSNCSCDLD